MSVFLCRACLTETMNLISIRNTQFQEVYEKLSNTKLVTEDGRPDTVCCTCYMHLQKCYNFSIMSQNAHKMLMQYYCDGIEIPPKASDTLHKMLDSSIIKNSSSSPNNHPSEEYMMSVDVTIKNEEPDPVKVELVEISERLVEDSDEIVPLENDENDDTKKNTRIFGGLMKPEKRRKEKQTHLSKPYCKRSSKINHAIENSYICTASFTEKDSLRRHRSHAGEKPYSCDECDKTFARNINLKAHIKIHIGERFSNCDICGKTFPDGYQLKRHMRSHTGEKPYKCVQCPRTFSDRSNLKKHVANHSGVKPYNCTECNASFSLNGNLRRHMRSHTGEKLFYCEICQKSLPDASLLKRHMRIHTGEKPYVCDACGKAYSDKDNLKKHVRLHTGEKPYACKLCDYRSAHSNCLKLHLGKKHSGIQ